MTTPFHSSSWFRVARLRPSLRGDLEVSRHHYRGRAWYVLRDPVAGTTHRIPPASYQFVGRLDGRATTEEVLAELIEELGADAPSQTEIVRLLSQLHAADLLQADAVPDAAHVEKRQSKRMRAKVMSYIKSPLAIRIPLFNPDRMLTASAPLFTPLFGVWGAVLWVLLVIAGSFSAALHWPELTEGLADRVLAGDNLLLLGATYVVVKALHELGHGYATKAFGGEVRETGIMLLVFFPVPYVDASASTIFRSKWQRISVGSAGIMVELALAATAACAWPFVESGLVRAFLFNVMVIGGISTLIFNGNPLLRFDGYYILCDLLEMPNLGQKSNQYWGYWVRSRLFGTREDKPFPASTFEIAIYWVYAPAALAYRLFVLFALALILVSRFFLVGVLLAVWTMVSGVLLPLGKLLHALLLGTRLRRRRFRAVATSAAAAGFVAAIVFAVPLPSHMNTVAVVMLPEDSAVRAGSDGFVRNILARSGDRVGKGQPLVELVDPDRAMLRQAAEARVAELDAAYTAVRYEDRVKAGTIALDRDRERAMLAREAQREEERLSRSPRDGVFVLEAEEDLIGRHVREGTILARVVPSTATILRVVVGQADIDRVRQTVRRIEVRLASQPDIVHEASLLRQVPSAAREVPSAAFGDALDNAIVVDPRDPGGVRTLQGIFLFDIELQQAPPRMGFETRAHVRFEFRSETLATRLGRGIRQLFLGRIDA